MYLFPLVDVKAVVLQFLLQDIRDADVNMDDLLLAFPLNINIRLNPLKQAQYEPLGTNSIETKRMWFSMKRNQGHKTSFGSINQFLQKYWFTKLIRVQI